MALAALSLLLHLLIGTTLWMADPLERRPPDLAVLDFDLVPTPPPPAPPPAPPKPPPEPPKPEPPKPAQPKPEPPKPEPPKPEPPKPEPPKPESPKPEPPKPEPPKADQPKPVLPRPERPPPKPEPHKVELPKPPKPQLARAPVKPHSAAPKPEGKAAPRPSSALNFSLPGPTTGVAEFGVHFSHGAPRPGELSQSAQDFILGQIVRRWRFDTRRLRGQKAVLTAGILIQADGTLAGPMHKDAPWNPAAIVPGYDNLLLDRDPAHQLAIDSFLRALRQAQPLELPPDDGKGWPRRMVLRFSVDEL